MCIRDRPDTVAAGGSETLAAAVSHDDDSVCIVEDSPHIDRKRKFDEIEDDSDVEEVGVVSPAKVLKVCEDSDVKVVSVEAPVEVISVDAPVDGEMASTAEDKMEQDMKAESKLSLPLSSETNIEDDYVVITPDDVPPVDSDEVLSTVAKMMPGLPSTESGDFSNDMLDTVAIPNVLLHREYVANPALSAVPADTSRCFTLGSYNILADYHAQKDYGDGKASWLTPGQLSLNSRHHRLMEELVYLDEDVICLQEVGGDYMQDMLQPSLER